MSLGVACKAFWAALFNADVAAKIQQAMNPDAGSRESTSERAAPPPAKAAPQPTRSDALTLLSALQREARFLDLVQESLDGYDDAQVGGAAREVLRDCRKTLDRMFAIQPLSEHDEGSAIDVESDHSPHRVRVVGTAGDRGVVTHRGWQASCCEVPVWQGQSVDSLVLSPTEVEGHSTGAAS